MKKTFYIESFARVKNTRVSFISITVFIMLAVGMFLGLDWSSTSMGASLENGLKEGHVHDIEVYIPWGASEEEIAELVNAEGVDEAEGVFIGCETFVWQGVTKIGKVFSLTEQVNTVTLMEGRMPEAENEVVVEAGTARIHEIGVGDVITFEKGDAYVNTALKLFKQYNSVNFEKDTETLTNLDTAGVNLKHSTVTVVGVVRSSEHLSSSRISYGSTFQDGLQVDSVFYADYDAFDSAVTGGEYNMVLLKSDALAEMDTKNDEYREGLQALTERVRSEIDELYAQNYREVRDGVDAMLSDARAVVALMSGLNPQEAETYQIQAERLSSVADLITETKAVMITRLDNAIFLYDDLLSAVMERIRYVLGGLFLIIALLVTYSVVIRMVNDEVNQIGIKKALGLTTREITWGYLIYSGCALLIGIVLSLGFALIVERFLLPTLTSTFNYEVIYASINFTVILTVVFSMILLVEAVTYIGCKTILRKNALALLQGTQQNERKNRFFDCMPRWQNRSLLTKSIVENCLNDKRRVFAMIVGVAACTAMVVTSLTLQEGIARCINDKMEEYLQFNTFVYQSEERDKDGIVEQETCGVEDYLENKGIESTGANRVVVYFDVGEETGLMGYIMALEDTKEAGTFLKLEDRFGNEAEFEGLWLPECYQRILGVCEGDTVSLKTVSGLAGESRVAGFYRYYSYQVMIFMDKNTYEEVFKEDYFANTRLCEINTAQRDEICQELREVDGCEGTFYYDNFLKLDVDMFLSIANALVALYLISAVFMSIFVLLNLLMTFVREKRREIIILRINGYSPKEAKRYVYSDTVVLTILGIIVGIIVGMIAGDLAIQCYESRYICFEHSPSFFACLAGVVFTLVMTFIMSVIVMRKVDGFKLTDL